MSKQPVLSICIPTYQRIEITRNTIKSIYADLDGVDMDDFEVIVSDNDPAESSRVFKLEFNYDNFHYFPTKCEGFLNSYYVLGYGKGEFLKLHNNCDRLLPGILKYIIGVVKENIKEKPILFFSNGNRNFKGMLKFNTADTFLCSLSYFSSWSGGFGIWKEDYEKIQVNNIDKMFPQTSMLFACLHKKSYILDNSKFMEGQLVVKKNGYNPYKVFAVDYLDLVHDIFKQSLISAKTFKKIKKDLFRKYLASRFLRTVILRYDKFDHSNIKKHLSKYYGNYGYIELFMWSLFSPFKYDFIGELKVYRKYIKN